MFSQTAPMLKLSDITYGVEGRNLIEHANVTIPTGHKVGLVGRNGTGKTTLFRMITGQEKPDDGALRLGETVDVAYVDQSRDALHPEDSVWQAISEGQETLTIDGRDLNSRAYVGRFNFNGSDQQKPVGKLSGGERNRVHLARLIKTGGNLLLLDEPTNDLDVDTLRHLEDALLSFPGCAVIISHDRWFLDRVATHILAFEGDSEVIWHEGNYTDYEAERKKRTGESNEPTRVKYKKLNV